MLSHYCLVALAILSPAIAVRTSMKVDKIVADDLARNAPELSALGRSTAVGGAACSVLVFLAAVIVSLPAFGIIELLTLSTGLLVSIIALMFTMLTSQFAFRPGRPSVVLHG